MMKQYFTGIDGGGSATRVMITDGQGSILGFGCAGPCNLNFCDESVARQNLSEAFELALADLDYPEWSCEGMHLAVAGAGNRRNITLLKNWAVEQNLANPENIGVSHDLLAAWAGALGMEPGLVVVLGTGSAGFGINEAGESQLVGGWGSLLDDDGSGYDIGLNALKAAVRMIDGRLEKCTILSLIYEKLATSERQKLIDRIYHNKLIRTEIASWAPDIIKLADKGDKVALSILQNGAEKVVTIVNAVKRGLFVNQVMPVAFTGSLVESNNSYRGMIIEKLQHRQQAINLIDAGLSSVSGSILLAMKKSGKPLKASILENLAKNK